MSDRPILFSAPMIRALLAGTKTQTRRIIKPRHNPNRPNLFDGTWSDDYVLDPGNQKWREDAYPWRVSDRLWVREAFSYEALDVDRNGFMPPWYWADRNPMTGDFTKPKPSIHMPRWASRLTLVVTGVKVERLQDISEEDAWAEGVCTWCEGLDKVPWTGLSIDDRRGLVRSAYGRAVNAYRHLWEHINGPGSWEANPWVVALTFTVRHSNIDVVDPTERQSLSELLELDAITIEEGR